jgi:hypothetical protein
VKPFHTESNLTTNGAISAGPDCSTVTLHLKGRIMELEETAVARQLLYRHMSMAMDTHTTMEALLEAVFSMQSVPRLYTFHSTWFSWAFLPIGVF